MTQVFASLFNEEKASEVAFFFAMKARENRSRLTSSRLMRLLYLTEKAFYLKYGSPLTGNRFFSTTAGPVLGSIFDFLTSSSPSSFGGGYLAGILSVHQCPDPNHQYVDLNSGVTLVSSDDLMSLSIANVEIMEEIWAKHGKKSAQELERFVQDPQNSPEWRWRGRTGEPKNSIELEDFLASLGFSDEEQTSMMEYLRTRDEINKAFSQ